MQTARSALFLYRLSTRVLLIEYTVSSMPSKILLRECGAFSEYSSVLVDDERHECEQCRQPSYQISSAV